LSRAKQSKKERKRLFGDYNLAFRFVWFVGGGETPLAAFCLVAAQVLPPPPLSLFGNYVIDVFELLLLLLPLPLFCT
jgi:hypothetical protein